MEIENHGGQLNAYTSRENTCYTMNVFKNKLNWGVEVLGDILTNSLYRKTSIENERSTIYNELLETQKMQMETTVENSHYGVYLIHIQPLNPHILHINSACGAQLESSRKHILPLLT